TRMRTTNKTAYSEMAWPRSLEQASPIVRATAKFSFGLRTGGDFQINAASHAQPSLRREVCGSYSDFLIRHLRFAKERHYFLVIRRSLGGQKLLQPPHLEMAVYEGSPLAINSTG